MSAEAPRCVWDARATLGEGPLWHAPHGVLYWVDIRGGTLHAYEPATGERRTWEREPAVTALAPRRGGGFVVATTQGFALWDDELALERWLGRPPGEPETNRCNDAKCDPRGRFFAGTMDDEERAVRGALHRLDPDLRTTCLVRDVEIPNGPAFDPTGARMIHVDTLQRTLFEYRLGSDGEVSDRRVLTTFEPALGYPDGLTFDADGHLWVAMWGGYAVLRLDPRGRVVRRLELPAPNVTSCAFGGPELATLFVTTARKGLDREALERHPLAGGLFAVETDHRGRPADAFAG